MKRPLPSIDDLRHLFDCGEDGNLVRKVTRCGSAKAGTIAGGIAPTGYLQVMVMGRPMLVHRIVWAMTHGRWPEQKVDHINGCKTDNRPSNLREASHSQNLWNRGASKASKLGIKGVSVTASGKFHARASANRVCRHFGTFSTVEAARAAYVKGAAELHGEFFNSGVEG